MASSKPVTGCKSVCVCVCVHACVRVCVCVCFVFQIPSVLLIVNGFLLMRVFLNKINMIKKQCSFVVVLLLFFLLLLLGGFLCGFFCFFGLLFLGWVFFCLGGYLGFWGFFLNFTVIEAGIDDAIA